MSRAHNARGKARRRRARTDVPRGVDAPRRRSRRLVALASGAVLLVIAIFAMALGMDGKASIDRQAVEHKVSHLLRGIPQGGARLGSPNAPITLWVFGDLECPTVKRFVEAYLPSIVRTWVRNGAVKLDYRSLKTDTVSERDFFEQEVAALAAGRQGQLWDYALTFVLEQGPRGTEYATERFLNDIASQVPRLGKASWRRERKEPQLRKQIAFEVYNAHRHGLRSTPSFFLGLDSRAQANGTIEDTGSVLKGLRASLSRIVADLVKESSDDVPTLKTL